MPLTIIKRPLTDCFSFWPGQDMYMRPQSPSDMVIAIVIYKRETALFKSNNIANITVG